MAKITASLLDGSNPSTVCCKQSASSKNREKKKKKKKNNENSIGRRRIKLGSIKRLLSAAPIVLCVIFTFITRLLLTTIVSPHIFRTPICFYLLTLRPY